MHESGGQRVAPDDDDDDDDDNDDGMRAGKTCPILDSRNSSMSDVVVRAANSFVHRMQSLRGTRRLITGL
jgi:hypothetical protein